MKGWRWSTIAITACLLARSMALVSAQAVPSSSDFQVTVLAKSPADTKTDLQIICLFQSTPANLLHGSLSELDQRLHGTLSQIRNAKGFSGELGETVLLTPSSGMIDAKKLLIIGLGDSETFTPGRMYLVGKIAFREANRLGVAHPHFAPTVLDGGVSRFATGAIAEQVVNGFRDAMATERLLRENNVAPAVTVVDFTFLAGPSHAADTQSGISRALGLPSSK
jgi:hypothetical protein